MHWMHYWAHFGTLLGTTLHCTESHPDSSRHHRLVRLARYLSPTDKRESVTSDGSLQIGTRNYSAVHCAVHVHSTAGSVQYTVHCTVLYIVHYLDTEVDTRQWL
jgi:hypothetical protein